MKTTRPCNSENTFLFKLQQLLLKLEQFKKCLQFFMSNHKIGQKVVILKIDYLAKESTCSIFVKKHC